MVVVEYTNLKMEINILVTSQQKKEIKKPRVIRGCCGPFVFHVVVVEGVVEATACWWSWWPLLYIIVKA
jgi:hypothetical protein